MNIYSQNDPRWGNKLLGHSTVSTIGGFGCTITDIGMILDTTPDAVNDRLRAVPGGFANGTLVNWAKLNQAFPQLKFIYRHSTFSEATMNDAIRRYGFVLLEVDYDNAPGTRDTHWVIARHDNIIRDPIDGRDKHISRYPRRTGLCVLELLQPPAPPIPPANPSNPIEEDFMSPEQFSQFMGAINKLQATVQALMVLQVVVHNPTLEKKKNNPAVFVVDKDSRIPLGNVDELDAFRTKIKEV